MEDLRDIRRGNVQFYVERYGYARRNGAWEGKPSAFWLREALMEVEQLIAEELKAAIEAAVGEIGKVAKVAERIDQLDQNTRDLASKPL